jgi:tetratricopeptide (TPR) repeat protein
MGRIELELDTQTIERARRVAQARHCTVEHLLGEMIEGLGSTAIEEDVFLGMLAKAPVRVRLEAAAALYKASRFEAAETVYKSVLKRRPNSYPTLLGLGYLARRRGDRAASLGYFQAALAAKPRRRRPKLEAAMELRKLSRMDEAEVLYRSVLQDHPNQVRALAGLGRIAQARVNVRLSIAYYQAAVAANPGRTDLKLEIASQLRKLSRLNEARWIYSSILAEQPDHAVARALLGKLAKPRKSGLPPMERSWLECDTFTRADEWGRNLEALGIPAFGLSLLTLAQDFAYGALEEVKPDCILIRRDDKAKILPLVSDWTEFDRVLEREAAALPSSSCLLGYVPGLYREGSTTDFEIVESHREFVYHRESVTGMVGPSLSTYRREVRLLLKAGAYVEPIGPANLDRVLACNDRWFAGKKQRGRKTYYRGRTLWTFENLSLLESLGVRHLAVVLDQDVVGYGVGSHIGASWAVFTFHRGDRERRGVAPYLLSEMAKQFPDRQWINDGPAVRKPGLAWFKDRFTLNAGERQMELGWIKV